MINSVHRLLLLGFVQGKTWKSREISRAGKLKKKIIIIMEFCLPNLCNRVIFNHLQNYCGGLCVCRLSHSFIFKFIMREIPANIYSV